MTYFRKFFLILFFISFRATAMENADVPANSTGFNEALKLGFPVGIISLGADGNTYYQGIMLAKTLFLDLNSQGLLSASIIKGCFYFFMNDLDLLNSYRERMLEEYEASNQNIAKRVIIGRWRVERKKASDPSA